LVKGLNAKEELRMLRLASFCCVSLTFLSLLPVHLPGGAKNPGITAAELTALLEKARAKHDLPALAAGILRGDAKPCLAVVGVRRRGDEALAMADDQWHLGSNTKPMTALLIALLIEAGLLDWDTPLEQIFPEHADQWHADLKKITPQHLLTHTSGLPGLGPLNWFLLGGTDGSPLKDRERAVKSLDTIKLTKKPGEKYEYSNLGYVVLGAIIDRRGKAPWEEQLEKKILQPLAIKHWSIGPGNAKDAATQPWPHKNDGKPVAAGGVMDNPQVLNSAGRVRLSVGDYASFLAETLKLARGDQGLLKPATAQKLFTQPHAVSLHTLSGWVGMRKQTEKLMLAHDGSNTMNYCSAIVVPDQKFACCVLTNQGGPGGPGHKACLDLLRQFREQEKR
jgi:CubicO group peptidase (beta-lactamase class C family)